MLYFAIITFIIAWAGFAGQVFGDDGVVADSAAAVAADSSLRISKAAADSATARKKAERASAYSPITPEASASFDPSRAGASDIFRSDGTNTAEILRYRSLTSVYIPFTLSSGMSRLLPYGSVVQGRSAVSSFATSMQFESSPPRFDGGGSASATQANDFTASLDGGFFYRPYPNAMIMPELAIFWENGAFSQNTLNLRLSRPLSPNLMLSAFSDYRYFEQKRFNHESNDIAKTFEIFHPDTSTIMNYGYNPLVEEHAMGGGLLWTGADSSKLYAAFAFSGLQNEYALNIVPPGPSTEARSLDRLSWALLNRTSYRVDASMLDKKAWILTTNIRSAIISESVESVFKPDSTIANGKGGAMNFFAEADAALPIGLGARAAVAVKNMEFYDGAKEIYPRYEPEVFFKRNVSIAGFSADADLRGGLSIFTSGGDAYYSTKAKAAASVSPNDYLKLDAFAKLDGITVFPDYDFRLSEDTTLTDVYYDTTHYYSRDNYFSAGASGTLRTKYIGAMLGYRFTEGIDSQTVRAAWPQGIPPYMEPTSSIIIAPWLPRLGGFSLLSRAIISDTKPYIKASMILSQIIRPKEMEHTFEIDLGFDYWSERDSVDFAGFYGWNDPIYDVNIKITAHIKTFRLFYKIDNLFNMKQAYVPGYFSPGITFRWGINWFLM